MMTRLMFGLALVVVAPAYAQAPRESYCSAGSAALMIGGKDALAKVAAECKTGDVVFMPGNSTAALGTLCDFKQTIHRSPDGSTLCVLKLPPRPVR